MSTRGTVAQSVEQLVEAQRVPGSIPGGTTTEEIDLRRSHRDEHGIGYFPHMLRALTFGVRCIFWTAEVFIHAFVPDLCTHTSEKMKAEIKRLDESC